jgi:hypothetical protein
VYCFKTFVTESSKVISDLLGAGRLPTGWLALADGGEVRNCLSGTP